MESTISLDTILNKRYALRKLLSNTAYHTCEKSIPKTDLSPEKEPMLRKKLQLLAKQIIASPDSIFLDVYDLEERKKDWISLQKKVILENQSILHIDTRSRPGHKILDHHMPHFYNVKNYKGISLRELFNETNLEKALLTNIQMHSTPYKSEIRRMITMIGGLGNVTKYRTVTSKAIVQYFGGKRVLDPCIGWGGRILGSLAANESVIYVGCEPDSNTAKGLFAILEDTAIPASVRSRALVLEKPVELALEDLKKLEKFDIVLTSPPYFNLEYYTSGLQSVESFPNWDDWTEKWLKVIILGCLSCLKETGVSCWSVKNFKTDKKYPLADITKQIHKDAGWELIKTVTMTGSGRPGGGRIEDGKETRESEEETYCFRRTV
jgi:hypothetical protein